MKKISVTMIVIFVAFLALVSGGSLLMKDREFSPNENRYLAEKVSEYTVKCLEKLNI